MSWPTKVSNTMEGIFPIRVASMKSINDMVVKDAPKFTTPEGRRGFIRNKMIAVIFLNRDD
jgi:hypothetical protein